MGSGLQSEMFKLVGLQHVLLHRYKAILENVEGRMRHLYRGDAPEHRIPRMVPSKQLDHILDSALR